MFNPDTDPDFLPIPIPDPGAKKTPDPGSTILVVIWFIDSNEKVNLTFPL
jgi:hypothetical protein